MAIINTSLVLSTKFRTFKLSPTNILKQTYGYKFRIINLYVYSKGEK